MTTDEVFEVVKALNIRPAIATDAPAIVALDKEVTGLAKPEYWKGMFELYGAQRQQQVFFLVAEDQGRLEGFVIGEVRAWEFGSPPCGWIFAIQVRPKRRLGGLATRLFNAICESFKSAGVDKVRTMLARDNNLILSFFRSQGMMAGPFIQLEMTLD